MGVNLEETFHRLLGLDEGWRVIGASYEEAENHFVIQVEETPRLWEQESARLGFAVSCYDHVEPLRWRHLNVFNKESVIICALPRGRYLDERASAKGVERVYRVTPPWEGKSKHFTRDFEAFALTLMREMPVKKAGEILGESDKRLWRMLFLHVGEAYRRLSMEEVVWVGADEMNRRKGHHYLTVFADLKARRVLFAAEGKDASTWEAFVDELLKHNGHPKAILQAAIDMSPAYIKGVKENLGNAQIVFDKFHVVREVNEAVEHVRRAEVQASAWGREQLARTQWIWRKNPENWTQNEALRTIELEKEHLQTATAYQMRLMLQGIYQCRRESAAREKFKRWCRWVRRRCARKGSELLEPMAKAAEMVEKHLEGILAHWKQGLTTAFLEGLNSLFSATKRKARGYRSIEYLKTMLYFVAGKLTIPCPTH
jgi:transposase